MAITYLPSEVIKKSLKDRNVKRLLSGNLTINRAALTMIERSGVISKERLEEVALKVIKGYKERFEGALEEGVSRSEAMAEALSGKKQLVNRVQNAALYEISQEIQDKFSGEMYEWLPSDADEPDPEHQLKYGQVFQVGVGEMPGDRYGCRCGMRILVKETTLKL